jgi:monovalent cation:H+ antiporter-2, CPA2 family
MSDSHLVVDLALAWGAAGLGGLLAQRVRQPPILGYLLAGVVIGPFTPGPVVQSGDVSVAAEIGVAFLMFALGVEFSLEELRDTGRVVVLAGPLQIVGTMMLGVLLSLPLGLSLRQGLFLGAILALSSTVVALKVLMGREEVQSLHGRIALGLLIAQDLAVVPLVVLLPILTGHGAADLTQLVLLVVKAGATIGGVYLVGTKLAPWLLRRAALGESRELFLLGVVGLALGTALVTQEIGLSLAFGAFVAGLAIAESTYRTQVLAEILPLRDLFTALFFVSIGILIDPATLVGKLGLVVLLASAVILGKTAIVTVIVTALGVPVRAALMSAATVAQIGEFSFVLAGLGMQTGAIPSSLFSVILATAVVTIMLSSPLLSIMPALAGPLERIGGRQALRAIADGGASDAKMTEHTVICGYGRVGREVASALKQHGLPYLVIELNPEIVEELQEEGVIAIFGDASSRVILEHANLEAAMLLAVLLPDPATCEVVTMHAREMCSHLDILARAASAEGAERLRQAGATNVVQPEFEAGLAVVGHALRRYGLSGPELARTVLSRRARYYRIRNRI